MNDNIDNPNVILDNFLYIQKTDYHWLVCVHVVAFKYYILRDILAIPDFVDDF